jgi:hypothetical protein
MSSSFSAKAGSLLILKASTRCGFNPWARQMRRTLASLMPTGRGHGASAPVRGVGRLLARGHGHHTHGQAGTDGGLAAGPGRVFLQPRYAQRQEALAPAGNLFRGDRHPGGDLLVRLARSRKPHDASAFHHPHRERSAPGLGFQPRPFVRTQRNGWGDSHPQASPLS